MAKRCWKSRSLHESFQLIDRPLFLGGRGNRAHQERNPAPPQRAWQLLIILLDLLRDIPFIACKKLIPSVTREDYGDVLPRKLRYQECRENGDVGQRLAEVRQELVH